MLFRSPTPSLILVPARFKTGKLYTPLATTSGGTVLGASGDFNVTRATNATRVNASGLIEVVASGVPRLDYYTSGGVAGCPALLVEPQAQNLYQQSEDFTNAYWSKTNSSISGNQTTAPDNTLTADKLIMNNGILPNAANQSGFNRTEVITSSAYRFSIFAKSAEFTGFRVRENAVEGTFLDVNLSNGTITNGSVAQFINPSAQNYGNGWYRISWTSPTITNLNKYSIRVGSTGDGTSGIFIWGAQVETGSVATSYIPTTTASVTRNADDISRSAISGCIGQTEGTIYAEVDIRALSQARIFLNIVDSGDGFASRIRLGITSGNVLYGLVSAATKNANTATTGIYKMALAYDSSGFVIYVNGTSYGTNAQTTGGTKSVIGIGFNPAAADYANDRIRSVALYTTRLTNAQLQALTT